MGNDCFGYNYIKQEFKANTNVNTENNYTHYLEEWKAATAVSQDFDKMLIDLRKYGFSIITGLITAGSFLGFSFSGSSTLSQESSIIHIGVMNVTMFLVVILFWLDVYYQNLLYGSVLRTRFLEFFRLNYRLSIYISGIYTGSRMGAILYLIYGGFLVGVFMLGIFELGIVNESDAISKSGSITNNLSNSTQVNTDISTSGTTNSNNNKISLYAFTQNNGALALSLLVFFGLSATGMILIVLIAVKSRDGKLNLLLEIFEKGRLDKEKEKSKPTDEEIMKMEEEIYKRLNPPGKRPGKV